MHFRKVISEAACSRVREILAAEDACGAEVPPIEGFWAAVDDSGPSPVIAGVVRLQRRSWWLTEVRNLYVLPDLRRRGVGRFLLRSAAERVETPMAAATVRWDNTPSRALFRSEGYRQADVFVRRGRTLCVVMKRIKEDCDA